MILHGKKVVLRPVRHSDLRNYLKWFNDAAVIKFLHTCLPATESFEKKWIEDTLIERRPVFIIEVKQKGKKRKAIGNCGLSGIDQKSRIGNFGIAIGEKRYWHKGYGAEAASMLVEYGFNILNLHKIVSSAYAPNAASLKMHNKIGFSKEGRQKQHTFINGKYEDIILYGLLRKEWLKMQKK